jgi:hypothetical protein
MVLPRPAGAYVSHESFDRNKFSDPVTVSNQWLPLPPGMESVLDGAVTDKDGSTPHRIVVTVSDVTKVIDGVRTLVVLERDFSDGQLEEEELAFVAQDSDGTVWNVGEYPEEYVDGKFAGAPSTWIPGNEEAREGISMQAVPEEGTPSYLQGYAPKIQFEDRGQVFKANQETCVRTGCYQNVLVVDEYNPAEQPQDGHQFKYHAPGVGVVRVTGEGGEEQENLELVEHRQLSPEETAKIRDRVLELDKRAYKVAKSSYGNTPPAEPMGQPQAAPAQPPAAAPSPAPVAAPAPQPGAQSAPEPVAAPAPQPVRTPASVTQPGVISPQPGSVAAPAPTPVAAPAPRTAPRVIPGAPIRTPAAIEARPDGAASPTSEVHPAPEPVALARTGSMTTAIMLLGGLMLALGGLFVATGRPMGASAVRSQAGE